LNDSTAQSPPDKQTGASMKRLALARILCVAAILAFANCTLVAGDPDAGTIKGPEAADLASGIHGYVVMWEAAGITALALPDCKQRVIVPPSADGTASIHAISGPDADGQIVYVEDHRHENDQDNRHLLKTIKLDGTQEAVIFTHKGSALWATTAAGHGEIGQHLALAPAGGRVALLHRVKSKQLPGALLSAGEMEIITLADGVSHATRVIALDEPMSWFPDGKRLAYSRLTTRAKLPKTTPGFDSFKSYFDNEWDELPAIYAFDTASGKDELLCVGWQPVIASDGKAAFIGGWGKKGFSWSRLDLQTRTFSEVSLPGLTQGIVAAPSQELLIYFGLPTAGTAVKQMKAFSPLRGPRPLQTIKVASIGSRRFQTIIPYADPRFAVSFGSTTVQRAPKTDAK
jgi:hypothetical protein